MKKFLLFKRYPFVISTIIILTYYWNEKCPFSGSSSPFFHFHFSIFSFFCVVVVVVSFVWIASTKNIKIVTFIHIKSHIFDYISNSFSISIYWTINELENKKMNAAELSSTVKLLQMKTCYLVLILEKLNWTHRLMDNFFLCFSFSFIFFSFFLWGRRIVVLNTQT